MSLPGNNFAYIDGANLHKGVSEAGWILDYKRFRIWLRDKYQVSQANIFIGYIPARKDLYAYLQRAGFILIFKDVVYDGRGQPKGNCDADLVLQAVRDHYEIPTSQAVLVTSDGDYACLVKFLAERERFQVVLSPGKESRCSVLLKRVGAPITYLESVRAKLEKAPGADRTAQGSLS